MHHKTGPVAERAFKAVVKYLKSDPIIDVKKISKKHEQILGKYEQIRNQKGNDTEFLKYARDMLNAKGQLAEQYGESFYTVLRRVY